MVVCKFFLQGHCKFGEKCWNEHTRNADHSYNRNVPFSNRGGKGGFGGGGSSGYGGGGFGDRGSSRYGGGGYSEGSYSGGSYSGGGYSGGGYTGGGYSGGSGFGANNRGSSNFRGGYKGEFNSSTSQSFDQKSSFGSSNRYSLLDQQGTGEETLTPTEMLDAIRKDVEEWVQGNMWPFSCYKATKAHANFPGFEDTSFEEFRHEAYLAVKNNTYEQYKKLFADLASTVSQKRKELMQPSQNSKAGLIEICKVIYAPTSSSSFSSSSGTSSTFGTSSFGSSGGTATNAFVSSGGTTSTFGSTTTNAFGSSGGTSSNFGSTTTNAFGSSGGTSSTFGSSSTPANPFGSNMGSSSGFGSSGFGSSGGATTGGLGSTGGFGAKPATQNVFGSSTFGQISGGGFGSTPSTPVSNPFAANNSNTGTFGKGPVQPATSAFAAPGLFGKGATGNTLSQVPGNSNIYTPMDQLTKEEREQFEASHFTLGKIPTRPPPKELVS